MAFQVDSLARLREFPDDAKSEAGHQLLEVQKGNDPTDWKPMKAIGQGVREIRISESSGAFRVIHLATLGNRVGVSHALQKNTADATRGYRSGHESAALVADRDGERLVMEIHTFGNVFDALAGTPAEAANLKARSALLSLVVDRMKTWS